MKLYLTKKDETVKAAFRAQAEEVEENWKLFFDQAFATFEDYKMIEHRSEYETCTTWYKFTFDGEHYTVMFELSKIGKDWSVKRLNFSVYGTDVWRSIVIRNYIRCVLKKCKKEMKKEMKEMKKTK